MASMRIGFKGQWLLGIYAGHEIQKPLLTAPAKAAA
jgi:hypothetical protein